MYVLPFLAFRMIVAPPDFSSKVAFCEGPKNYWFRRAILCQEPRIGVSVSYHNGVYLCHEWNGRKKNRLLAEQVKKKGRQRKKFRLMFEVFFTVSSLREADERNLGTNPPKIYQLPSAHWPTVSAVWGSALVQLGPIDPMHKWQLFE